MLRRSCPSVSAMLPFKLVYHDRYDLNLGPHVFPSQKFRLIYEMLLREGFAKEEDFLKPSPANDDDILRLSIGFLDHKIAQSFRGPGRERHTDDLTTPTPFQRAHW